MFLMNNYIILTTESFDKEFKELPQEIQTRFKKQFIRLQTDPLATGKPLRGSKYFRELKNTKYRVYYLVYETEVLVLLAGLSNKKTQQEEIEYINSNLNILQKHIQESKALNRKIS